MPEMTDGIARLLDELLAAVRELREEVRELRGEVKQLQGQVVHLEAQVGAGPGTGDLDKRLTLVEARLGALESSMDRQGERQGERIGAIEQRVGGLERSDDRAAGAREGATGQRDMIRWVLGVLGALMALAAAWGWTRP